MKYDNVKNRGVATIVVAGIMLGFLLLFLVLAIDFSRMYYVRGELQSAADSAALAGADKLDDTGSAVQTNARNEAVNFAAANSAANTSVVLASDGTNTLKPGNDITVGHWDSATKVYKSHDDDASLPVNAIQVRARRTTDSPGGAVDLLFGKLIAGLTNMGVSRVAISTRPAKVDNLFAICNDAALCPASCTYPTTCAFSPARIIDLTSGTGNRMIFTSLLASPPNANGLQDLMCGPQPNQDVCGQIINLFPASGAASVYSALESEMYNTNLDKGNKTIVAGVVTSWTIIVPVIPCSVILIPSPPPSSVLGYAKVTLTKVCAPGGGGGGGSSLCAHTPSHGGCSGGENDIAISSISCITCADKDKMLGFKAGLVK